MKVAIIFILFSFLIKGENLNIWDLYYSYENYKVNDVNGRNFGHGLLKSYLQRFSDSGVLQLKTAGYSVEEKEIFLVNLGTGKKNVLIWSQMHGDEPTATMALFDILKFLISDDELNYIRSTILSKLSIYIIPMLNPDGARKFKRTNALEIDLNRDALRLQSPESKILKAVRDSINAEFGFNLHDQSRYYSAGNTDKSAAVSFLAPAFNYSKDVNEVREKTMKVIGQISDYLNVFIPGHIGRYNDDFEPRAFGDNMVKWGTSSILIESGGWKDDNENQFLRKLNFIAILSGLYSIATESYENVPVRKYWNIPENNRNRFDLILRNLLLKENGNQYIVDLAINRYEWLDYESNSFRTSGSIVEFGDLSVFTAYEDYNLKGYEIEFNGIVGNTVNFEPDKTQVIQLLSEGVLWLKSKNENNSLTSLKFNYSSENFIPKRSKNADFLIKKENRIDYAVVNGFFINVKTGKIPENFKGTVRK